MIALLVVAMTLSVPDADLQYLGGLLCGEAQGMPRQAMELVAENIAIDYLEHGRHWLRGRWYAPLKPSRECTEMMRDALELDVFRRCRLVGNAEDILTWQDGGCIAPDAVPDYEWHAHGMTVAAFDCVARPARVRVPWTCEGERCPQ